MTLDMQKILKDAPPIGFKKDQFTPFGKWLVDSKDRDAHIARQVALQVLDVTLGLIQIERNDVHVVKQKAVTAKLSYMYDLINALRAQISEEESHDIR